MAKIHSLAKKFNFFRSSRGIAVNGLWVTRECKVRPVPNEPFVRIVFEASKIMPDQTIFEELVIEDNGRHKYSDYFRELTKSYYLNP